MLTGRSLPLVSQAKSFAGALRMIAAFTLCQSSDSSNSSAIASSMFTIVDNGAAVFGYSCYVSSTACFDGFNAIINLPIE